MADRELTQGEITVKERERWQVKNFRGESFNGGKKSKIIVSLQKPEGQKLGREKRKYRH